MEKRKDNNGRVLNKGEQQRPNGSYAYRYTENGKRKTIYAENLNALRKKIKDIERLKDEGLDYSSQTLTLNGLFENWKITKRGIKPNTWSNYLYMYEKYVFDTYGTKKLKDITNSNIKEFYLELFNKKRLSVNTIDAIHNVIYQILEQALNDNRIRRNYASNAMKDLKREKSIKIENVKEKNTALTKYEQETLYKYLLQDSSVSKWAPIIIFQFETGLRIGELTGLTWDNVNLDENIKYIRIDHTLVYYDDANKKGLTYDIQKPKTESGVRIVPLSKLAIEMLEKEKEYQKLNDISCKVEIKGFSNFVFLNKDGNLFNQGTINKGIRRCIKSCNASLIANGVEDDEKLLPQFSSHCGRHTFATRLIENKLDVKTAQKILGHKDIKTTLDRYCNYEQERVLVNLSQYFEEREKEND